MLTISQEPRNLRMYFELLYKPNIYAFHNCRFVLQHGGRALIADEMGLGKTVQVKHCL